MNNVLQFKIPHCMQYAYNGSLAYSEHCCYPHLVLPPMFNTCGEDNADKKEADNDKPAERRTE